MFVSLLDNKELRVEKGEPVDIKVTKFKVNGPYIDVEGFATFQHIQTFSEDRIRKSLILAPAMDVEKYRGANREAADLSDEEIIELKSLYVPLDNCPYSSLETNDRKILREDMDPLSGFRGTIDFSTITEGKPLKSGEYNVFLKLEQMPADEEERKFEKVLPLSGIREVMKSEVLTTRIQSFSPQKVLKYNLMLSFDKYTKSLRINNKLLQSYDPRKMEGPVGKEHHYVKAFKRRFFKLMYMLFSILPIEKKKTVFASDSRSELNGNFYFVYEELYKRNMDLDIKFIFNERINNKKSIVDLIKVAYHFATAKIILLDDFYPLIYPLKIRKNADLIQVWHAAGAFKTFGYSRIGRPGGPSVHSLNHRNYTKAVVSSEGIRKHYAEGFGISMDKVYPTGIPRADIFFDEEYKTHVRNRLYKKYPFLKDKKVILFAPTFRGNGQASAHYPFEVLNLKKLYKEFSDDYVFIFKIHPFVNNKLSIPYEYADFFHDMSDFREINDLLLVTDILITDYSSVCFEFALLNKPMLFFSYDVEKYILERDFYYNYFEFIPGPLVKSTEEMIDKIKNEDFEMDKIKPFVDYFFDDTLGRASKNVVDQLIIPSLNKESKKERAEAEILPPPASRIELFERSIAEEDEENK